MNLPTCITSKETSEKLKLLGAAWAADSERPRIATDVLAHWDNLIVAWMDSDLPLAFRKSNGVRGEVVFHRSGRKLVCADNSPAQWAFRRAYAGHTYGIADIEHMLGRDEIPFAFAHKSTEKPKRTYHRALGSDGVNKQGWKLCHIDDVGLGSPTPLAETPIDDLKAHFRRLMSPVNHFLIPLVWAGLGEVPEVVAAMREFEKQSMSLARSSIRDS
jgi:hypothetical protein